MTREQWKKHEHDERLDRRFRDTSGDSLARANIKNFKFGNYLKKSKGDSPIKMKNPHAHHIVVKGQFKNRSKIIQTYAKYSRQVLKSYGIDPYKGLENLYWAPNKGHSDVYIKSVAKELYNLKINNAIRHQVIGRLEWIAKQLKVSKFPI
ncbi:hypothetical protein HGI79_21620 [Clostridium sp. DJ247]|nr:hypothetical protein [Clostridium sp. DJ247]